MKDDAEVALDAAILEAHEREDSALLAKLYGEAADRKRSQGDIDACWFLTTQAYVFALESGHPDSVELHAALKAAGRDE